MIGADGTPVVDIAAVRNTGCGESPAKVTVDAQVCNRGDVRVGPGVQVSMFVDGVLGAVGATTGTLEPGDCEAVSVVVEVPASPEFFDLEVRVDDDGTGVGTNRECLEDNNSATQQDLRCEGIG